MCANLCSRERCESANRVDDVRAVAQRPHERVHETLADRSYPLNVGSRGVVKCGCKQLGGARRTMIDPDDDGQMNKRGTDCANRVNAIPLNGESDGHGTREVTGDSSRRGNVTSRVSTKVDNQSRRMLGNGALQCDR